MNIFICSRILGILLMVFSITNLTPILIAQIFHDGDAAPFFAAFVVTFALGFFCWLPCRQRKKELKIRDGFLISVLFWVVLSLFGALPLMLASKPHMALTDAVFESISGLTATGATVLKGLDSLPHSVLYYRQQLQFLGGMGIIILAVAILPMLGIGGMQLVRTEMTGPIKDNKLTPRITETAKTLWFIYIGLTILCTIAFYFNGMSFFDAMCYAFSTVSTGGYAPHDASLGFYPQTSLRIIAIFFMIAGALNFALHFIAFKHLSTKPYTQDAETKNYIAVLSILSIIIIFLLWRFNVGDSFVQNVVDTVFHVVSLCTTTGLNTTRYDEWPSFIPMLLLYGGIIGGCAGSTTSGIKMIRITLVCKQGLREIKRLIHPRGLFPLKFSHYIVPWRVIDAVWGFIGIYLALFVFLFLLLLSTGLSQETALASLMACLSNTGASLGEVAQTYTTVPSAAKWILSFAMLLGRLEIFTVLVLFTPSFWQK